MVQHLRLVGSLETRLQTGCRSRRCELPSASPDGLCLACDAVYATAEALYRRLVTRDLARLERRTPGIGCAALAALHERVTRPDQPGARARRSAPDESQRWTPEDWELDRLDACLAELRAAAVPTGEAS